MKERDISLDVIRILACCMIVFMHSPMPSSAANGTFLAALSYFTAPGIGLFFMISGALLLPVNTDYFTFIRRRLSKIIFPTLFWTAVYLFLKIYFSESEINILQSIFSIPFSPQGHGVLWFMYTLIGLYLLAPILGAWLERVTAKEIEFVLMLWAVSLCYPLFENILIVNKGTTGILYYFTGYAGYFLLGYYLKNYPGRLRLFIPTIISIIGIGLIVWLKIKGIEFDFYRLFWYESIFIASLCVFMWIVIRKCFNRIKYLFASPQILNRVIKMQSLTFGVYLIHILIMRYWLWKIEWIATMSNYILQTLIVAIVSLLISFIACALISKTRFAPIIIGVKKSN